MTHRAIFNQTFASLVFVTLLVLGGAAAVDAKNKNGNACTLDDKIPLTQCGDGKDNQIGDGNDYGYGPGKGDGKIDYCGLDSTGPEGKPDGILDFEPDPACSGAADQTEEGDTIAKGSLIPCTDKCTAADIFRLINNLISFFFRTLLIPIFVFMLMYMGFQYFKARGNPGQHAKLLSMFKHMIGGLVIILLAWLIVKTIITAVGYSDDLLFLGK